MGKPTSSIKKGNALGAARAPSNAARPEDFDDSDDGVASVVEQRVESTIVSRETATHLAFAKSRKEDFVYAATDHYVRILNDHCEWDREAPHSAVLAVVGQPGNGKSALLAHWADQRRRSGKGARELIYEHYSGCSYDSVKLSLFLFRFMNQLKISYNLRDFELPREHEEEKLKFSFSRCLEAAVGKDHATGPASKRKRIVLVLDGIDCIRTEDGGDSLSWLPNTFPLGVRIIVSTTQTSARGKSQLTSCKLVTRKPAAYDDDGDLVYDTTLAPREQEPHTIRELRRRNATFVVAEPLDESSCLAILQLYEEKQQELHPDEKAMIVRARGSSNPLYVRLLLHSLELFEPKQSEERLLWLERACQSNQLNVVYELLMKQWNTILLADLFGELNQRKATLDGSNVTAITKAGVVGGPDQADIESLQVAIEQRALLVRHTLSLLSVSRYGLSEGDLLKLFGDSVSRSVSQQLLVLLRPHLMQIRRYDCGSSASVIHAASPSNTIPASSNNVKVENTESEVVVLYDLSHNQLRLLTRYGFLRDDQLRHCYYRELAVYFEAMDACQRRVDELPVQLERCAMWSVLQSALVNIKMFQLWWGERNRQEFFSYWMVLSSNCSVHDPVDDFIRSLDEYIAHEAPSAEQLLSLFLTITDFLRTWQKVDDSRTRSVVLNRPKPPQLHEFMASLGNSGTTNLSEGEAKRVQREIDALGIHADDGYYVRRWLWTQFPLIGIAFESRVFRNTASSRASGSTSGSTNANDAVSGSKEDANTSDLSSVGEIVSPSPTKGHVRGSHQLPNAGATTKRASGGATTGSVLSKGPAVEKAKKAAGAGKRRPSHKMPPPLALEAGGEDEIGALEFLSAESSEGSLASVSKLESQLVELRMRYDKAKFAAREKTEALRVLESRVLDARAEATAAGQSATQLDELQESTRGVNDEALLGRQRSDYYRAILRHCEVNPARDPNTIETAEANVAKLRREIVELQQKTQVISYEKRLAGLEVPKLQQVTQDKAAIHQTALSRLRWRQELDRRLYYASLSAKDGGKDSLALTPVSPSRGALDSKKGVVLSSLGTPFWPLGVDHSRMGTGSTQETAATAAPASSTATDANFVRAKEKLLHMKETSLARQKNAESLQLYVGSAYKDDGVLGALRHVGLNKPEEALLYWQNQLEHSVQLEAEEKQAEQRVAEYREQLENLQAQFVNLKLNGSPSARVDVAPDASAGAGAGASADASAGASGNAGAGAGASASVSTSASTDEEAGAAKAGVNVKQLEQQLAEATAAKQKKKERAVRLRALHEKLQLGLLHVAQLLGVPAVQQLTAVELVDAIEKVVRLVLGDEAHLQAAASQGLRRKNSVRAAAGQLGATVMLPSDTRSDDDKARFNIRVRRGEGRQMNPYVDLPSDDDEPDDDGDDDEDADNSDNSDNSDNNEHRDAGGDPEERDVCVEGPRRSRRRSSVVQKRRDIKNLSKFEIEKKRAAQKRADKKKV